MKFKFWLATIAMILSVFVSLSIAENAKASADASIKYGNVALSFEPAQTPGRFLSSSGRYSLSLGAQESLVGVQASPDHAAQLLRFKFEKSNPAAQLEALDRLPGVVNHYIGKDSRNWRVGVPTFGKLQAKNVYPGVDVVYYGDHRRLEFDFVVAPGADPRAVQIAFSGQKGVHTSNGALVVDMEGQTIEFAQPYAYQRVDGKNVPVKVEYSLLSANQVQLQVGDYDTNRELVIDPVMSYSTFLGGSQEDTATGMAINATGEAFIAGKSCSVDLFAANPNPSGTTFKGSCDAYVTKLSADGSSLIYTTFLAGVVPDPPTSASAANGIAIDAAGRAYIVGTTNFFDMPTVNMYQGGDSDAFISILNPDGTLLRAAYLGGRNVDEGFGIAVDRQLNVTAVGKTCSFDFPAYNGFEAKVETCVAFATKLDFGLHIPTQGTGTSALSPRPASLSDTCGLVCPATAPVTQADADQVYYFFSVLYGGQLVPPEATWPVGRYSYPTSALPVPAGAITIGSFRDCSPGAAYIAYVMIAEEAGTTAGLDFVCGTVAKDVRIADLGGFNWKILGKVEIPVFATTSAFGVALDPVGDVFVVGGTNTGSLAPFSRVGVTGAWIVKVAANDGGLIYSTALGSNATDDSETVNAARAVAVDTLGRAFVVGTTTGGMRITDGGVNKAPQGGTDVFAIKLNTAGSGVDYGTYLGGSGNDEGLAVTVDSGGWAYIAGSTTSADLPMLNAILDSNNTAMTQLKGQDAFVAKVSPSGAALIMSAYYGGSRDEQGRAIAVNTVGDIFIAGNTTSPDLPVVPLADINNPVPGKTTLAGNNDAFVAKILGTSFPKASFSPANLDFGPQVVGTVSGTKTATLRNIGTGVLTIPAITTTGDYTQTNNCGARLTVAGTAGDNCTITVTFRPTAVGTRSGTINIVDDAADSPQVINLTGSGTLVSGTVAPVSLTFASIEVSKTTAAQSVTVTNTDATHNLIVSSAVITGDFKISSNGCTAVVAPAGTCSITVSFTPTATGSRTGTLIINGNAGVFPVTIPLTGTGAQASPDFTVTGAPAQFQISPGQTNGFDITVAPINGFSQRVTVTCQVSAPATCSASPTSLDASTSSVAHISVSVPAGTGYTPRGGASAQLMREVLPFCIMGIVLVGRRRKFWIAMLIVVVCCVALVSVGCGGGGGASNTTINGMSPGSYPMSVTVSYTGGGTTLSHVSNVTMRVQ